MCIRNRVTNLQCSENIRHIFCLPVSKQVVAVPVCMIWSVQNLYKKSDASVRLSVPRSQQALTLYPATDCAQRSFAVEPLSSRLAMLGSPSHSASVHTVSRYQFTHVWCRTAAAGRARWQLANWCTRGANWLSETSLTATARGGVLDCGLWLACAALLRLMPRHCFVYKYTTVQKYPQCQVG